MKTSIYLIRHGATAANREVPYRLQGRALDLPLDEVGVEQAARAAVALSTVEFVAVYSSPLLRARQTAAKLADPRGLETLIDPELIEASLGRWEGLTWDEANARDPELYERFHANPGMTPYPDGESFQQVRERVTPAIARIAAAHPGLKDAMICHNVTARSYLSGLMGIPIDLARAIRQANGGINLVEFEDGRAVVAMVNGCLHL